MEKLDAKSYIKLGTAVRYLKDVLYKISSQHSSPEPLGGDHVIDNLKTVLDLIEQLKMTGTLSSGAYKRLRSLHGALKEANKNQTHISLDDAKVLHELAKEIRLALLAEGDSHSLYRLTDKELESIATGGWPDPLTLDHLRRIPLPLAAWCTGALVMAFTLGVSFSELGVASRVRQAIFPPTADVDGQATPTLSPVGSSPFRPHANPAG